MKKIITAVLAMVTAVSVLTVTAGAEAVKDELKIGSGKTISVPVLEESVNYKIVMPKSGTLTINYEHHNERMAWALYDSNGKTITVGKQEASAGTTEWIDCALGFYWDGRIFGNYTGVFNCFWNSFSETAKGYANYAIDKGTYYIRITRFESGEAGLKLKLTAKDLEGKAIGGSTATDVTIQIPLQKGKTMQLSGILTPSAAKGTKKWTSSKTSVATVDKTTGKVTAKSTGTTVITCTVGDISAKIRIKVT